METRRKNKLGIEEHFCEAVWLLHEGQCSRTCGCRKCDRPARYRVETMFGSVAWLCSVCYDAAGIDPRLYRLWIDDPDCLPDRFLEENLYDVEEFLNRFHALEDEGLAALTETVSGR